MRSKTDQILEDWQQLTATVPRPEPRLHRRTRSTFGVRSMSVGLVLTVTVTLLAVYVGQTLLPVRNGTSGAFGGSPSATPTTSPALQISPRASSTTPMPSSQSPTLIPVAPIGHGTEPTDQLLLMEITGGGIVGGQTPPDILFVLYGDGRAVYRYLVPGVSEAPRQEVRLTEDQVQAVLRFALDNGLPQSKTFYPRDSYGPAPSTIFEIRVDELTKQVEYELPPGNLMDDPDAALTVLKPLAARLMAFDPTSFGALGPSPSPLPPGVPSLSVWNGSILSTVVAVNGMDVFPLDPGQEVAPIDARLLPPLPWAVSVRTQGGFELASVTMNDSTSSSLAFDRSCGRIVVWTGDLKLRAILGNGRSGDCGP